MGRAKRTVPKELPKKLKKLRLGMKLSLEKMVAALEPELVKLGYNDMNLHSGYIAEFENGKREPVLPVLLAYGRISGINVEVLIDDQIKLSFK